MKKKELERQIAALKEEEKAIVEKELREVATSLMTEIKRCNYDVWAHRIDDWKIVIRKKPQESILSEAKTCKSKIETFASRLTTLGAKIQEYEKRPQVFIIDGKKANMRCRNKERIISGNRSFWYSISFDVLEGVDCVIYLLKGGFITLPPKFLSEIKDRLYYPRSGRNMGVFDIDEERLSIILQGGEEDIDSYYHLYPSNEKDYQKFYNTLVRF